MGSGVAPGTHQDQGELCRKNKTVVGERLSQSAIQSGVADAMAHS
jgi:hypothetical protein